MICFHFVTIMEGLVYDYQFNDDAFAVWVLIHQTWRAMRKSEERLLAKTGLTPEKK